MYPDNKILVIC